jgi:basic membrane protein A
MYKNLAGRAVLAWVAACCLSPAFSQTSQVPQAPGKPPLKIGFVYVTPVTDAGWVRQHEEGRKAVEAALGDKVKTTYVENVAEGADAERVIRDLAQQGNTLIFTPSFGYMEPTLKVAKDFPGVRFESVTGYKTAPNVATSNARYYEGRYLAGVAAGRMTKTNVAGYVGGLSHSGGAAGHQRVHAGHALGEPERQGQRRVAQRVVRSAEGA